MDRNGIELLQTIEHFQEMLKNPRKTYDFLNELLQNENKNINPFAMVIIKRTAQELTDEWQPYTGGYRKEIYAIRLKDGSEYDWAWPNAGMFCLENGKDVPLSEVTHVKKGRNPFR